MSALGGLIGKLRIMSFYTPALLAALVATTACAERPHGAADGAPAPADAAPIDATQRLAIVDMHVHVLPPALGDNDRYLDDLVAAMDRAGVSRIALGLHARHLPFRPPTYSAGHDQLVLAAYQRYPTRIAPMLAGFDPDDPGAVDYVRGELQTGPWRGIGELDVRNTPKQTETAANHPTLMAIYALAGEHHVPVLVHFEPCYGTPCADGIAELEDALDTNPSTVIISAHSCFPPELMTRHPNLYCEWETPNGELPHGFGDRVMVGTDVQSPDLMIHRPDQGTADTYEHVIDRLREEIAAAHPVDGDLVAAGNADALLGPAAL